MPYTVTQFETTPNPNAIKCWLDRPICRGSRGFRTAESAAAHPVAQALFERAGATGVLLLDDWLTVNKPEATSWPTMKRRIRRVLADALDALDALDSSRARGRARRVRRARFARLVRRAQRDRRRRRRDAR